MSDASIVIEGDELTFRGEVYRQDRGRAIGLNVTKVRLIETLSGPIGHTGHHVVSRSLTGIARLAQGDMIAALGLPGIPGVEFFLRSGNDNKGAPLRQNGSCMFGFVDDDPVRYFFDGWIPEEFFSDIVAHLRSEAMEGLTVSVKTDLWLRAADTRLPEREPACFYIMKAEGQTLTTSAVRLEGITVYSSESEFHYGG